MSPAGEGQKEPPAPEAAASAAVAAAGLEMLPGQLRPGDARAFGKAVVKALRPTMPDTSTHPANVSDKQLRSEVEDHWKEVQRQFRPAIGNAEATGWVVKKVISGTTMVLTLWSRLQDGRGPNGEQPPASLESAAPSDQLARLSAENENLRREVERLRFEAKRAVSRRDGGDGLPSELADGPDLAPKRGDGTVDPNA